MHKNPLFNLALIFLALVVGYGIGKRGEPASSPLRPFQKLEKEESQTSYKEKYLSLKSRFDELNKIDIEEYLKLESQKEKYNKANDILGKILVIFLAELGLKVSNEARDYAEVMTNNPEELAYREGAKEREHKSSHAGNFSKEARKGLGVQSWKDRAKDIEKVTSEEGAKKFLDSVEIKDIISELRVPQKMKKKTFNWLRGEFSGYIEFEEPKSDRWDVKMSLYGEWLEGGKIKGQNSIKLYKNGELSSDSSGNGKIESYKAVKDHPDAVIVAVGGRNGFFQIFRAEALNQFIGNYYREGKVGEFKRVGKVYLERQ